MSKICLKFLNIDANAFLNIFVEKPDPVLNDRFLYGVTNIQNGCGEILILRAIALGLQCITKCQAEIALNVCHIDRSIIVYCAVTLANRPVCRKQIKALLIKL